MRNEISIKNDIFILKKQNLETSLQIYKKIVFFAKYISLFKFYHSEKEALENNTPKKEELRRLLKEASTSMALSTHKQFNLGLSLKIP